MKLSRLWSSDMLSAAFVIALGLGGLAALGNAEVGTASEMGTGYLPRLITLLVLGGGFALAVLALLRDGEAMPELRGKPLALISLSIAAFAATVDQLGMVVAVVSSTLIASLASSESRWRETILLAGGIALCAVLVFVLGLKMPIPIWPR